MTRRLLPVLAVLAASLVLSLPTAASTAMAVPASGGNLYVLQAAEGTLSGSKLVLRGVDPRVTSFTDRPQRSASSLPVSRFARGWSGIFGDDPPNAALQVGGAPDGRDVAVLELRHPHYDSARHVLTYSVRRLRGTGDDALRSFDRRADGNAVKSFGRASLFVDDGGSAVVSVQLEAEMPPLSSFRVTFSNTEIGLEPSGEGTRPTVFTSPLSGAGSFTAVEIGSRSLTVTVPPGGGGEQVKITLFVTAPAGAKLTGKTTIYGGSPQGTIVAFGGGEAQPLRNGPFALPFEATEPVEPE